MTGRWLMADVGDQVLYRRASRLDTRRLVARHGREVRAAWGVVVETVGPFAVRVEWRKGGYSLIPRGDQHWAWDRAEMGEESAWEKRKNDPGE